MTDLVIRDLSGMGEFFEAVQLHRDVWGADEPEDPAKLMMVLQDQGGLVAGAFDDECLVGYVFGFMARERHVQHSHKLAVHPSKRCQGLGLRLKHYQRDWCLERDIKSIRWTFDPLRHTNAHLNITRLGAEVLTYYNNYYGVIKGVNADLPTDRLLVQWDLSSEMTGVRANSVTPEVDDGVVAVSIPRDLNQLIVNSPKAAHDARLRVRHALTWHLENGYAVRHFDADESAYILTKKKEKCSAPNTQTA